MATQETLQPDKLLPPNSILEKIKAQSADAAKTVISYAEDVAARRQAEDMRFFSKLRRAFTETLDQASINLAEYPGPDGSGVPLSILSPQSYQAAIEAENLKKIMQEQAKTGDNMRLALRKVMAEYGMTEDSLALTDDEKAALCLIYPEKIPASAPAATKKNSSFIWRLFS